MVCFGGINHAFDFQVINSRRDNKSLYNTTKFRSVEKRQS